MENWNEPSWTLSVEFFFYLAFPVIIIGIRKLSTRGVIAGMAIVVAAIFIIRARSVLGVNAIADIVPVPLERFPEFLLGVLIGTLYIRGKAPESSIALYACMILVVLIMSASQSPLIQPVAAVLFAAIIILTTTSLRQNLLGRLLNNNTMVLLGGASYVLYIAQVPVRKWMDLLFVGSAYESVGRLLYIPIMIVFSVFVFVFFEEKMRRLIRSRWQTTVQPST
jgi:peptidoglycan/LPS O-acetylase OafA/YrhL